MIINVEIIILSSQFIKPAKYEEITVYQIALFKSINFHISQTSYSIDISIGNLFKSALSTKDFFSRPSLPST